MKSLHLPNLYLLYFSVSYTAFNLFSYGKLPKTESSPRKPRNKTKHQTRINHLHVSVIFFYIRAWINTSGEHRAHTLPLPNQAHLQAALHCQAHRLWFYCSWRQWFLGVGWMGLWHRITWYSAWLTLNITL